MSFTAARRDLFIEFKENAIHVLDREDGTEIPLERDANGRVAAGSLTNSANQLRAFLESHGGILGRVAYCSIPARGVSLRRLKIPSAPADEVRRLLTMQVEAQLPVAPSELAWGSAPLRADDANGNGAPAMQEFLVAAVKRDLLDDYQRLLLNAGLRGHFTVGALARQPLCSGAPEQFSMLDSGATRSELASFDRRGAVSVRVLGVGSQTLNSDTVFPPENGVGQKLYLSGSNRGEAIAAHISAPIEVLDSLPANGRTTANLGLKRLVESGFEPLLLGAHEVPTAKPRSATWKWAATAATLAVLALALRYAEALIFRARLDRKSAGIASYRATLPKIEREFAFLNYIKTNQPPYLDTVAALALSAPPGTKIETLSIVRHGELSLRGSTSDAQAPGTFRSKLIDSGFFSRVVVDEQTPSPDGQKVTFRLSALLKPDGLRKPLPVTAAKNTSTNKTVIAEPTKKQS